VSQILTTNLDTLFHLHANYYLQQFVLQKKENLYLKTDPGIA